MHKQGVDRLFLGVVVALLVLGFLIFISAALGSLAQGESVFNNLIAGQVLFGFIFGAIALMIGIRVKYTFWRTHAFWVLLGTIFIAALVFVPGVGMAHGGAKRWIDLGITTFQPGEMLKFGRSEEHV